MSTQLFVGLMGLGFLGYLLYGYFHPKEKDVYRLRDTYIDNDGYRRYLNTDELVHVKLAKQYDFFFPGCEIHHKDGNKLNNKLSNLLPLTPHDHAQIHTDYLFLKGKVYRRVNGPPPSQRHVIVKNGIYYVKQ